MVSQRPESFDPPGLERKSPAPIQITAGVTPTQIATIAWTVPANAVGYLQKLWITNLNAGNAIVTIWDADITSTGTVPPTRGSTAAPLLPPIFLLPNAMVIVGEDLCPNVEIQGGIVAQSTVNSVYIKVQYLEQIG